MFTGLVRKSLDDDEYGALQLTLLLRPEQGPLIPGSGGLRKIRWGKEGRGKRSSRCFMLFLFAKNEQGDLTPSQVRTLSLALSVRSFDEA